MGDKGGKKDKAKSDKQKKAKNDKTKKKQGSNSVSGIAGR